MQPSVIIFYILAAAIIVCSALAVSARRMLRAATYLLFVLLGTAGIYLMLNYHFLAAVQLSVYAGGILVLFIFAIMLTSQKGDKTNEPQDRRRMLGGAAAALAGVVITGAVIFKHWFVYGYNPSLEGDKQIPMQDIGTALMGTGKFQYLLPFEVLSVLLLACIIGGILIARKR